MGGIESGNRYTQGGMQMKALKKKAVDVLKNTSALEKKSKDLSLKSDMLLHRVKLMLKNSSCNG